MNPELFQVVAAIAGGLGGWWLNATWKAVRDLQHADFELTRKVASVEVLVAGEYIKRDEFERLGAAIFQKLDRIETKLDGKADK